MSTKYLRSLLFGVCLCLSGLAVAANFTGNYQPTVQYDSNIFNGVQMSSAPGNVSISNGAGPNDLNLTLTFNSQTVSVPLVVSGNVATLPGTSYDLGTATALSLVVMSDGNNMALAYLQREKSGGLPLPVSVAIAVWQRSPTATNPSFLLGNWNAAPSYGDPNIRNLAGLTPNAFGCCFTFTKTGSTFIGNYSGSNGQETFILSVSGGAASLAAPPVTGNGGVIHALNAVYDNVGKGALVHVGSEFGDPTDVSVNLMLLTRALSSSTNSLPLRRDFNGGDGKSDILWRHTNGSTALWLMDGLNATSGAVVLGAGSGWSVKHTGDFNGDGKSDILWQHDDGSAAVWLMDGLNLANGAVLLGAASGWSAHRVGDFNGDGKSDIVWQHADGSTAVWLMDGLNVTSGSVVMGGSSGWRVRQIADFNGDGKSDIVWQHTSGNTAIWLMDGLNVTSGAIVMDAASGWRLRQTGDFNGDGRSDIVWEHASGGSAVWLMNGLNVVGGAVVMGAGSGWSAKLIGDFNRDGKSDIVWQHSDGSTALWLMNGLNVASGAVVMGAGSGWSAKEMGDFNGDGRSDILWQHTNGSTALWLMDGLNVTGGAVVMGAGSGWVPVTSDSPFTLLAARMTTTRIMHTATLLQNGQVLLTGGLLDSSLVALDTAELYDPATNTFTAIVSRMTVPRSEHKATLLPNGWVLITGGQNDGNGDGTNTAELYNPATQTFIPLVSTMSTPRGGHEATLLPDGQVLLTGGYFNDSVALNSAELYNPATQLFTPLASTMAARRAGHAASLLPNGQVLLTGGGSSHVDVNTAELYNPATQTFTAIAKTMTRVRAAHESTLLPNGQILVTGGANGVSPTIFTPINSTESYDPVTGAFTGLPYQFVTPRAGHTATLLPNGKVLFTGGGTGYASNVIVLNTVELYEP